MRQRAYPSDVTNAEWKILEPLIPPAKEGGRPRTTDMREVLGAIFYVDRTGCQWRALPHDFPPWSTVWSYFRTWRNDEFCPGVALCPRRQLMVNIRTRFQNDFVASVGAPDTHKY